MIIFPFQDGQGIAFVNVGGGMIDISACKQKDKHWEEIAAPQCTYPPFMSFLSLNTLRQATSKALPLCQPMRKTFVRVS